MDWELFGNIRYVVKLIAEAPIEDAQKLELIVKLIFDTTSEEKYEENTAYIASFFEEKDKTQNEQARLEQNIVNDANEDQQKLNEIRNSLQSLITKGTK